MEPVIVAIHTHTDFALRHDGYRQSWTQQICEESILPVINAMSPLENSFMGEDFGRSGDLSVFVIAQQNKSLKLATRLLVELRNIPFEQQRQILFFILDRIPRFQSGAMDARGNGQYLGEVAQQRYGDRIEPVALSETWYRENMPPLKSDVEEAMLVLPQDTDVRDDLKAVKMVNGIAKVPTGQHNTGSDGKQRHGDAAIAYAMLKYASKRDVEHYDYQPVKPNLEQPNEDRECRSGHGLKGFFGRFF